MTRTVRRPLLSRVMCGPRPHPTSSGHWHTSSGSLSNGEFGSSHLIDQRRTACRRGRDCIWGVLLAFPAHSVHGSRRFTRSPIASANFTRSDVPSLRCTPKATSNGSDDEAEADHPDKHRHFELARTQQEKDERKQRKGRRPALPA